MPKCVHCGKESAGPSRSQASHGHYFATLRQCWLHMPENLQQDFPTSHILRKWALIKAGYRDEAIYAAETSEEAERVAVLARQIKDDYCIALVRDNVVKILTAKSQDAHHMDAATFNKSKDAVFDVIGALIGVPVEEIKENDRRSA